MKNAGVIVIIIGVLMIIYTGFNIVTKKEVADIGPIEINKEENHPVQWSPIVGVVLLVSGVALVVLSKKNA